VKRHPALRPLSDDHHRALVLARRLRRSAAGADAEALERLAGEVAAEFMHALEPHFEVEERVLLPLLRARGAAALAERTADDHARLRALARGVFAAETPRALGALLERHGRFEERELFPRAEALLAEQELAAVHAAWAERAGRRGG
jgi:hemerythrin-like domain-containing protein